MKPLSGVGISLTLSLSMAVLAVRADDYSWRPSGAPPAVARQREALSRSAPTVRLCRPEPVAEPRPTPGASAVTLGAPVVLGTPVAPIARTSYTPSPATPPRPVFRAQAPDAVAPPVGGGVPPPPLGPPPGDIYANGVVTPGGGGGNWFTEGWGQFKDTFERRAGQRFQSDNLCDFAEFASPVSSPFLAEDPRALTEVKPLFIYQTIPGDNSVFRGGSVEFFGLQARLALTERWSIVMNKLGGIAIQPDDKTVIGDESGFAELWIGPKYTFYRDEINKSAAAVGLTFQIPIGSEKLFQDTGDLSLSPYISFAKGFGKLPQGYGNFNFMSTSGFSFGVDKQRSDYFYTNLHLDFDVAGQHRFYPLIELNWIRYVSNGGRVPFDFEGGDLVNFGSTNVNKENIVTLALGARYKLGGRDNIQFGGAFEFPLTNEKGINDFRITLDVIFRY